MRRYLIFIILALFCSSCNLFQGPGGKNRDIYFKIIFTSNASGNSDIYSMNTDGTDIKRLTSNSAGEMWGRYSPNGEKITFNSNRSGSYKIYVADKDGSNATQVSFSGGDSFMPIFSPDSKYVYYYGFYSGQYHIFRVPVTGASNSTQITSSGSPNNHFDISPDGEKIVFATMRDGNYEIYLMNSDGSNPVNLSNDGSFDDYPAFSPDGSKIIFTSDRDGGDTEIWETDLSGSYFKRLTYLYKTVRHPRYNMDGSKIVFGSFHTLNWGIYSINSDGSDLSKVLNTGNAEIFPSFSKVLED